MLEQTDSGSPTEDSKETQAKPNLNRMGTEHRNVRLLFLLTSGSHSLSSVPL